MHKLVSVLATASMLGLGFLSPAYAEPVGGYDALYNTMITACSLPDGAVLDCNDAITAYATALVNDNIDEDTSNKSFMEARAFVFEVNAPDPEFQADIDALFELLLPNSGAIDGIGVLGEPPEEPS